MRVDSSGNVGIGTTSPTVEANFITLSLNQTLQSRIELRSSDVTRARFLADSANTVLESVGATPLQLRTDSTERIRINATGNVGIGRDSPATKLDVNGDVTITDKIIQSGDTNTAIRFPSADTVSIETNGSEALRIDSSQNISAGVTTARAGVDFRKSQIVMPRFDSGKYLISAFSGATAVNTTLITQTIPNNNWTMTVLVEVINTRGENNGAGVTRFITGVQRASGTVTAGAVTEISETTMYGVNPKAVLTWTVVGNVATLVANNNAAFASTMYEVTVSYYSDGSPANGTINFGA
jgi:hypothetical protein